jgi:hypothetical protein
MPVPDIYAIGKSLDSALYAVLFPAGVKMSERNKPFDPKKEKLKLWARPTVKFGKPVTLEKGDETSLGERPGVFIVQLFTLPDIGTREAKNICVSVEVAFRLRTFDGVHCGEPYTDEVGIEAGGGWYQFNITIPFWTWIGE